LISHDAVWLNKMLEARDNLLRDKLQYLHNIAALSKLDSYIRPVINSVAAALDRFGYERANPTPKTLEDLFNEEIEPAGDTESKNEPEE
jgi:phage gp29-like protein